MMKKQPNDHSYNKRNKLYEYLVTYNQMKRNMQRCIVKFIRQLDRDKNIKKQSN